MDNNDFLIGEIHATVKGIKENFDAHLEDYKGHKDRVENIERNQYKISAAFGTVGAAIGSLVTAVLHKIGIT